MIKKGHIVTVASMAGIVGVAGLADYCASKFGAVGFDESLRMELNGLKSNVKTTCICPFFIDTGMFEGVKSKYHFFLPILNESRHKLYQFRLCYTKNNFGYTVRWTNCNDAVVM